MPRKVIEMDQWPQLHDPLFIAGFEGWGNALDISKTFVDYLINKLEAKVFAKVNPDFFYRFDEHRPLVQIENGLIKKITLPGAFFYATHRAPSQRDLIILKATEPDLAWNYFAENVLGLCQQIGVKTIVSIGGMYDNVLHTDMLISAIASSEELLASLKDKKINTGDYQGPSAIHTTLLAMAQANGFECISFWCHCPYYLQGTTHYGLLAKLGAILSDWGGFELDTHEWETTWQNLNKQIHELIDKNPELQGMINELRKAKFKGLSHESSKNDKVIHLENFLKPH
jgi:proteasome assembly chaperone (PAC2) family protein